VELHFTKEIGMVINIFLIEKMKIWFRIPSGMLRSVEKAITPQTLHSVGMQLINNL